MQAIYGVLHVGKAVLLDVLMSVGMLILAILMLSVLAFGALQFDQGGVAPMEHYPIERSDKASPPVGPNNGIPVGLWALVLGDPASPVVRLSRNPQLIL